MLISGLSLSSPYCQTQRVGFGTPNPRDNKPEPTNQSNQGSQTEPSYTRPNLKGASREQIARKHQHWGNPTTSN